METRETSPEQPDANRVAFCTCANLRKATRAVTQIYDGALSPVDLRATQFTLLATLDNRGDATMTRLAEALVMDRTTLTRNLKPLVRRGLVHIEQEADQRVRTVRLTDTGRAVLAEAKPLWAKAQTQTIEALGPDRWSGFVEDLRATIAGIRA